MTFRFKQTGVVVPIAGTAIAHGLAFTPDEYFTVYRAAAAGALPADMVFFSSTPVDATNVHLDCGSTGTVDVFAAYNHSVIR
jgi:hypothetical protein